MGDAFRGLTIRLGADARPLQSAISSITRSASAATKQFNAMNKALRFDGNNVAAMQMRLDLIEDKARLTASAANKIETAMSQAAKRTLEFSERSGLGSKNLKKMAADTKEVYAANQRLHASYTHINADLQHIYDAAKVAAVESGKFGKITSFEKADKFVNALRRHLDDFNEKGEKAKAILSQLIQSSAFRTDITEMFGLEQTAGSARKLVSIWNNLRSAQKDFQNDLEAMNEVEGYRAMQTQLIAYEAELREAAAQAARFSAELHSLGTGGYLASSLNEIKMINGAVEASSAHARQLASAYAAIPQSLEVAKSRIASERAAMTALSGELKSIRSALAAIRNDPAFSEQAANAKDAYVNAARVEHEYTEIKAKLIAAEEAQRNFNEQLDEMKQNKASETSNEFRELEGHIKRNSEYITRLKAEMASIDDRHAVASLVMRFKELEAREAEVIAKTAALKQEISSVQHLAGNLRTMGYGLYSTITPAILIMGRYAIQAADDVDAAYRDMRKTVNGTEEEFEHLRQAALEFGRTHVTSADKILEIEAIGGQLSIQTQNLEKFGEVVSNLDIATNLDTETISQNLGQLSNIMRDMNQDIESGPGSLQAFSDALVRLGNNSAAQEDKIMNVMMRIASMGTISNMTTPDLLALATATAATGQGAEAAGTALSRTFSNIESAVGKGGAKLEKFAEVSGMSAQQFSDAWQNRPMEAFQAFIEGLKRVDKEGGSVANTLSELGINSVRQRQTLMGLTTTTEVLSNALVMSNDAWSGVGDTWGAAGDAAREASRKAEGFSGQLQIMKNAAQELGVTLLDSAVPMIKDLTRTFQTLTGIVSGMPDFGKAIVVKLMAAAAAAGPLLIAFGAIVDGANKVAKAFETVKGAWTMRAAGKTFLPAITAELAANQASINKVVAAQQRHVASLGVESQALNAHKAQLMADRAALEAERLEYDRVSAAAAKFKTVIKGIGATVGIMAAFEAVNMVISSISEAISKYQEYEKATRGLSEAASEFSKAAASQSSSIKDNAEAVSASADTYDDLVKDVSSLADTFKENKDSAEASASVVESYAKKLMELNGQCDNNAEQLATLSTYVNAYNKATGSSVEIINEHTGALSVDNAELEKSIELMRKQAYAEGAKKNAEAASQELAKHSSEVERYNKLLEERQSIVDKWERKRSEKGYLSDIDLGARSGELTRVMNELKELKPIEDLINAEEKAWADFEKLSGGAKKFSDETKDSLNEAGIGMSMFADEADEVTEEMKQLEDAVDAITEKFPEFGEMFSGISIEEFQTLLAEMGLSIEDVASGVEEMAQKVSDGFNEIEVNSEASLEKYLETLQHNKEVTEAWSDNLKTLYEKSSDETFQSWVREMAKAGPEYSQLIADMASQDASTLEQEAAAWKEARESGADAYLDSVGLTSKQAQQKVREMSWGITDILTSLNGMKIEYYVDDNGTIHVNTEKLDEFNRVGLAKKGYIVSDDGTLIDMTDKCNTFNLVKINDKYYYVSDKNTVYDEQGKVIELQGLIDRIPRTVTTIFDGDDSALDSVINRVREKLAAASNLRATVAIAAGGNAAGGYSSSLIRAIPRHAAGALNGIVAKPTLTNIGWVGEAGAEAILHMRNAGGAVIPLSNRQYVRPFARAVASEMSTGNSIGSITMNLYQQEGEDMEAFADLCITKLEDRISMGA